MSNEGSIQKSKGIRRLANRLIIITAAVGAALTAIALLFDMTWLLGW